MKSLLLAVATLFAATSAFAEYPERTITIIVPFAAGGPTDKVARDLAEAMRKPLGNQSIVIENIGGAGGTLGAARAAHSSNDGYTLLLHHIGMATSLRCIARCPTTRSAISKTSAWSTKCR
jgi:tripartite-type tricarboxylate transporter receptor subunit TctC